MKMTKQNEIATRTEEVNLSNPSDIMEFATNLKSLIVENKLSTPIKGRNYVNVEGWQIAGAFTGTFPIVEVVENLSEGNTYKYRAEVSLRNKEGEKVGYGVAICTNKESGKQNFDEYAVASMAQTRAVGKAYRMKIGWLLKIAGYETTPAEEMPAEAEVIKPKSKFTEQEIATAKLRLGCVKDMLELKETYLNLGAIAKDPEIIKYKDEMKTKLGAENE